MASCLKCGKHPIRKSRQGRYSCRRCGPRPEPVGASRVWPPLELPTATTDQGQLA